MFFIFNLWKILLVIKFIFVHSNDYMLESTNFFLYYIRGGFNIEFLSVKKKCKNQMNFVDFDF